MRANLIESDPTVMMGKPVITGTRITVELILEKLAAGETIGQIIEAYPRLTEDAVRAALAFAAEALRADVVYPTGGKKPMSFLADEGVDFPGVQSLRSDRHLEDIPAAQILRSQTIQIAEERFACLHHHFFALGVLAVRSSPPTQQQ